VGPSIRAALTHNTENPVNWFAPIQTHGLRPSHGYRVLKESERPNRPRDPPRSSRPAQRLVAEPVLDHWCPDDSGNRQQQRPPELPPKHFDRMTGMLVVAGVGFRVRTRNSGGIVCR
jgi:hypothetical protein